MIKVRKIIVTHSPVNFVQRFVFGTCKIIGADLNQAFGCVHSEWFKFLSICEKKTSFSAQISCDKYYYTWVFKISKMILIRIPAYALCSVHARLKQTLTLRLIMFSFCINESFTLNPNYLS